MKLYSALFIPLFVTMTSCKSYYNASIDWTDNLVLGTDIEIIKAQQPDYLQIDWENPDTLDYQVLYQITQIKGNQDILNMENYLVFKNNNYQGRTSHK